jgi:hypothetical protein
LKKKQKPRRVAKIKRVAMRAAIIKHVDKRAANIKGVAKRVAKYIHPSDKWIALCTKLREAKLREEGLVVQKWLI